MIFFKTKKESKLTCLQVCGRTIKKYKEIVTELSSQKSGWQLLFGGRNLRSEETARVFWELAAMFSFLTWTLLDNVHSVVIY